MVLPQAVLVVAPIERISRIHSIYSSEFLEKNLDCTAAPWAMAIGAEVWPPIGHRRELREAVPAAGKVHSTIHSSPIAGVA